MVFYFPAGLELGVVHHVVDGTHAAQEEDFPTGKAAV